MPQWESSYRRHGLWDGTKRLGFIGIGPRGMWTKADGYGWYSDVTYAEGRAKTLREAKKAVEREAAK